MISTLCLLFVSINWNIRYIDGNNSYLLVKENEFRVSEKNIKSIVLPQFDFLFKVGRFSKINLTKQSIYKPSDYKEMIIDEETKIGVYKDNITIFYGKLYIDFKEVEKEKEIISFFGTPFFTRVESGKVIIFSADKGYFLYCIKCIGEIWKQEKANNFNTETAISVKNLIPRGIFFISDSSVESEIADDELFSLLEELESRMNKRGKFSKDILYSQTNEVPPAKSPDKKKFDEFPKTELDKFRQDILVETICYELLKAGKSCSTRK